MTSCQNNNDPFTTFRVKMEPKTADQGELGWAYYPYSEPGEENRAVYTTFASGWVRQTVKPIALAHRAVDLTAGGFGTSQPTATNSLSGDTEQMAGSGPRLSTASLAGIIVVAVLVPLISTVVFGFYFIRRRKMLQAKKEAEEANCGDGPDEEWNGKPELDAIYAVSKKAGLQVRERGELDASLATLPPMELDSTALPVISPHAVEIGGMASSELETGDNLIGR